MVSYDIQYWSEGIGYIVLFVHKYTPVISVKGGFLYCLLVNGLYFISRKYE